LQFDGLFDSLQLRGAYGDYRHAELEGGAVGTSFAGNGLEFRADLVQNTRGGWRGRSGVQYFTRKLTIVGDEAFVPDNVIDRVGVFTLQSFESGPFEVEAAGRYERASIIATTIGYERSFGMWSGAAGLSWDPAEHWTVGVSYIRGARAPAAEELLSDGPHIATQSYELGDATFVVERSNGFEAFARYKGERVTFSLTGYHTSFDKFIAAVPTGAIKDDLPVFAYRQLPATFKGFEASASWQAAQWSDGGLTLDASADYTRAELDGIGPVPRIPPLRVQGGVELEAKALRLRAEVEWNEAQDRVAAFENPVAGFTIVNLSVDWHPLGENGPLTLLLSANNLFDVEARRSSSFTRDFVPLAGRDLRVTAKLAF
jgi:iron complex outermembrane receptor protein